MNSQNDHPDNMLASYLGELNKKIEPYSKAILFGVGALILVAVGFALMRSRANEQKSDATLQAIMQSQSGNAEAYGEIAEKYGTSAPGIWARLAQADLHLNEGVQNLLSGETGGEELIQEASREYELVATETKDTVMVSRASYGMARSAESLGEVDKAIAAYEEVIEINESEQMVKKAQSRINQLKQPITKEFLAWFKDFEPNDGDPSLPPGLPGMDSLPGDSSFSLPPLNFGGTDTEGENTMPLPEGGADADDSETSDTDAEPAEEGMTLEAAQEEAVEKSDEAADEAKEAATEKSDDVKEASDEKVEAKADEVKEAVKKMTEAAEEKAVEKTSEAAEKTSEAAEKTSEAAEKTSEAVEKAADKAKDAVKETAEEVKDAVTDAADDAK